MRRAIFPGSFDPLTLGHYDIIKRGITLFDELVIAIGINADKKYMFSLEERQKFIVEAFIDEPKIKVVTYEGLTVDFCKEINDHYGDDDLSDEEDDPILNQILMNQVKHMMKTK